MRTTGRVKWFDAAKGEGCVVSESGCQAALHRATLEAFGLDALAPGAAIAYDVMLMNDGLTVTAIHAVDGERRARAKGATVKWFDPAKGAKVARQKPRDIVLPASAPSPSRTTVLAPSAVAKAEGATVEVDVIEKVKGLQARRLR